MSDFLQPHGLQHVRPPSPSPTPGVYSNSCPLSRWCHPTTSSSVVPFFSHLQSFKYQGKPQVFAFPLWLILFETVPFRIWVSVQFSCTVVSDSLQPHILQHARPPCPSPTPRVCSNSCPFSWWCQPIISSSVGPFSSHLQSFKYQGLFKWVSSLHQVAKVLEFQL